MKYRKNRSRRNQKSSTRRYRINLGGESFFSRLKQKTWNNFAPLLRRFTTKQPPRNTAATPPQRSQSAPPPQSSFSRFRQFFTRKKKPTFDDEQVSLHIDATRLPPPLVAVPPDDVLHEATEERVIDENKLLESLTIDHTESNIRVKLYNDYVEILCYIDKDLNKDLKKDIKIIGFYKKKDREEIGIARCALYYLLKKLVDDKTIDLNQNVYVVSPTPSDGNLQRLINMYKDMGFDLREPQPGTLINLNAPVEKLMSTLVLQCSGKYKIRKNTKSDAAAPPLPSGKYKNRRNTKSVAAAPPP